MLNRGDATAIRYGAYVPLPALQNRRSLRCKHRLGRFWQLGFCQPVRRPALRLTIQTTRFACKSIKGAVATLLAASHRWLNAERRHRGARPNASSIHIMRPHVIGNAIFTRACARRANQVSSAFSNCPGLSSPCAKDTCLSLFRKLCLTPLGPRRHKGRTRRHERGAECGGRALSRVVLARPCRRQVRAKLQRLRADDGGKPGRARSKS
jgi:hypothetical protein